MHMANGTTDVFICVGFSLKFSIFQKPNKNKCEGVSKVENTVLKS